MTNCKEIAETISKIQLEKIKSSEAVKKLRKTPVQLTGIKEASDHELHLLQRMCCVKSERCITDTLVSI